MMFLYVKPKGVTEIVANDIPRNADEVWWIEAVAIKKNQLFTLLGRAHSHSKERENIEK